MHSTLPPTAGVSSERLASLSSITERVNRGVGAVQRLTGSIPPSGLLLLSSFAIQVATVYAKSLFDTLGEVGAGFLCKGFATILLLLICRPNFKNHRLRDYQVVIYLGVVLALNTITIYGAIARIPLGIASTLEFIGPLGVAIAGSRRSLDFLWVILAGIGVVLLNPMNNAALDPVGVLLALVSGGCWAAYILLANAAGKIFPGKHGLALSMTVASLLLLPPGLHQAGAAILKPEVLLLGLAIGIIGTVIPFSMEYVALKRMPPRIFGVMMSIEPAIAAIVGLIFLNEVLSLRAVAAIVMVILAAIGATWFGYRDK